MNFFNNYPAVKLLCTGILGIFCAKLVPDPEWVILPLLLVALAGILIAWRYRPYWLLFVYAVFLSFLLFLLFYINTLSCQPRHCPELSGEQAFVGEILEKPQEKKHSFQTFVRLRYPASGPIGNQKLLVYLEKSKAIKDAETGDLIAARSTLKKIKGPEHPFEFDYRKYMAGKHICYSTFIFDKKFRIHKTTDLLVSINTEKIRTKLITILRSKLCDNQTFQIVSALTLGYKKELSPETRRCFTSTGAMHILAVSGLHVGMIFLFLKMLFAFMRHTQTGRFIFLFLTGSLLWLYACITGLSPSVQRAAFMFTFILIGENRHRPVSSYNTIAASAFFLLLINPGFLTDIGFQLSYAAVTSIVFFYPRIEQLITAQNKLLKKAGQLLGVSIAAQIGTFPLSVYYFHQFPVYFWLSNFVVIPAAYLFLVFTFLLFISPSATATQIIAWILTHITKIVTGLLTRIGKLPFAVIDGLYLSKIQLFFLFFILISTMFYIKYKKRFYLFSGLSFLLFFEMTGLIGKIKLFGQQKLIIYPAKEHLFQFVNGRNCYFLTDLDTIPKPDSYKNSIIFLRIKSTRVINIEKDRTELFKDLVMKNGVIRFANKTFILKKGPPPRMSLRMTDTTKNEELKPGIINLKKE